MKKLWLTFLIVISTIALVGCAVAIVSAQTLWDGRVYWNGINGADRLSCEFGGHWVLSGNNIDITSAQLTVLDWSGPMEQHGKGAWSADSIGALPTSLQGSDVYTDYSGNVGDGFLKLSHCNGGSTTTPTLPPSPSNTATFTATNTPTETNTPTQTPTGTLTPTETPTVTPTPTESPTVTPTLTTAPTQPPKKATYIPPKPAVADNTEPYPTAPIGVMYANGTSYLVYPAVGSPDGVLLLPTAEKGGALYNNQIWIHRTWNTGWFKLANNEVVTVVYYNGTAYTYQLTGNTRLPYGQYPTDTAFHIISCYGENPGKWDGVQVYDFKLINIERNIQ